MGGPDSVTCGLEVRDGQQGVECDICGNWSHAVCQKVSKAAYNALSKHIRILAFICDACRQRPSFLDMQAKPSTRDASVQASDSCGQPGIQSRDTDVLSCLKEKVQLLESSIQELTKMIADSKQTMNTMVETQQQSLHSSQQRTYAESLKSPPGVHSEADCAPHQTVQASVNTWSRGSRHHTPSNNEYRYVVRAELREMEERKKRVSSLVVRGLRVGTAGEASTKFADIASSLIGERVEFTEVCRIKSDVDLYRGNVHDGRIRKLILDNAKHLRESSNSHVFIRRDLTFQQREELRARYPPRSHMCRVGISAGKN